MSVQIQARGYNRPIWCFTHQPSTAGLLLSVQRIGPMQCPSYHQWTAGVLTSLLVDTTAALWLLQHCSDNGSTRRLDDVTHVGRYVTSALQQICRKKPLRFLLFIQRHSPTCDVFEQELTKQSGLKLVMSNITTLTRWETNRNINKNEMRWNADQNKFCIFFNLPFPLIAASVTASVCQSLKYSLTDKLPQTNHTASHCFVLLYCL